MNVIRMTPSPPSRGNPAVTADLDALVGRALAKPVEGRSSSALALSSDLRRIAVALDAREGVSPPAELIPVVRESSGARRAAILVGAGLLAIVLVWLWF
jgi:hypothetical protein